jgi:hypothetical protein
VHAGGLDEQVRLVGASARINDVDRLEIMRLVARDGGARSVLQFRIARGRWSRPETKLNFPRAVRGLSGIC